jgi:hypothetical protein
METNHDQLNANRTLELHCTLPLLGTMRLTLTGCAVFICYAMDKDTHSVTNAEVHEVFSQV